MSLASVFVKVALIGVIFKKYKTFSVLIYSFINTSGNWKNEKLCGNTTPAGRSVFTQFRVFPIFTSVDITVYQYGKNVLYFFYNIAQRTLTEEWREIFRVDIVISTRLLANQRSEFTNAILELEFLVFPSSRVDITVYQHEKCFIFLKFNTLANLFE